MFKKSFVFLFIFLIISSLSFNISLAEVKKKEVKDTTAQSGQQQAQGTADKKKEFLREKHPCEIDTSRNDSTAKSGVLQYDIDCVPFHQNEILDLTGKSSYSIVGISVINLLRNDAINFTR